MTDHKSELLAAHRKNLIRYCQLLATDLTDLERDYLHRRIAETRKDIERLDASGNGLSESASAARAIAA